MHFSLQKTSYILTNCEMVRALVLLSVRL